MTTEAQGRAPVRRECPDGETCHYRCDDMDYDKTRPGVCFRVLSCQLSGVYPDNAGPGSPPLPPSLSDRIGKALAILPAGPELVSPFELARRVRAARTALKGEEE